jgi:Myb-like DNA-binding domain
MNSTHHHPPMLNIRCNDIGEAATPYTKAPSMVTFVVRESVQLAQPQQALLSTYRVPRQRRRKYTNNNNTKGLWSETEQHQFLMGLMLYGWGQWKEIGTVIPTR